MQLVDILRSVARLLHPGVEQQQFDQRPMVRLRNALLFTVQYFWVTVGTALLQLVWWLLMVLFAPWTLLLLPFVGSWFDLFVALFLLYDRLDKAFEIEKSIARAFPEQAPREEREGD